MAQVYGSVKLEAVQHCIRRLFPREEFAGIVAQSEWDYRLDALAVELRRSVYSERLIDETVQWPATWWDAFKDRWFPRWLRCRYPVRWNNADFTIYRGYPDMVMPEHKSVMFSLRDYEAS